MQDLEPLTHNAHRYVSDTGHIASRLVEASDQARLDRVRACAEDDGYRRRQAFDHRCRASTGGSRDDRDAASDQISGQFRHTTVLIVAPAIFDGDVTALFEA